MTILVSCDRFRGVMRFTNGAAVTRRRIVAAGCGSVNTMVTESTVSKYRRRYSFHERRALEGQDNRPLLVPSMSKVSPQADRSSLPNC
jgi:hypothetical protein